MDDQQFDNLTRSLARGTSRRGLLKGLAGAVLGGGALLGGTSGGDAFICRQPGVLCGKDAQCCSGSCVNYHCGCPNGAVSCGGQCCAADQLCQGGYCVTPCTPSTCAAQGVQCGSISDGCGGTLQCGDCPSAPCSTSSCDQGQCTLTPIAGCCTSDGQCDDGDACTVDACDLGSNTCTHTPVICPASDACHTASCDPNQGCVQTPIDDGTSCGSGGQICQQGTCACPSGTKDCGGSCQQCCAADDCPGTTCSPATCTNGVCGRAPIEGCCTQDADCGDNNACTVDTCDQTSHTCQHTPAADNIPCGPNQVCCNQTCCTAGETCQNGQCVADPCAGVSCPTCQTCSGGGCVADSGQDRAACTADGQAGTCQNGSCMATCTALGGACTADTSCCSGHCGRLGIVVGTCCIPDGQPAAPALACCNGQAGNVNNGDGAVCAACMPDCPSCQTRDPNTGQCLANACGLTEDSCGNPLDCGNFCFGSTVCHNGKCCQPKTCADFTQCGTFDDGCGGSITCGCPECQACSNGSCVAACSATCSCGPCEICNNGLCVATCTGACQQCTSNFCYNLCGTDHPGCSCPPLSGACDQRSGFCLSNCFVAGTRVTMADGTSKPIELVAIGDRVLGHSGVNRVLEIVRPTLGRQLLYALNDSTPFVTAGHPFLTTDGWKAVDPAASPLEVPGLPVGRLAVGDRLLALAGVVVPAGVGTLGDERGEVRVESMLLQQLVGHLAEPSTPLYNLRVDGDHTYIANDLVVHNKFL